MKNDDFDSRFIWLLFPRSTTAFSKTQKLKWELSKSSWNESHYDPEVSPVNFGKILSDGTRSSSLTNQQKLSLIAEIKMHLDRSRGMEDFIK